MLYHADWSAAGTTKVVPYVRLLVTEGTMSCQNLVYVKVAVKSPEKNSREDLVHMSTSGALVPAALSFCHGTGQENPLVLASSLLNNHVYLKAFRVCLR